MPMFSKESTKTKENGKTFQENTTKKTKKMLSSMMLYLQKTRPKTHSTAFNENSKTIFKLTKIADMKKF